MSATTAMLPSADPGLWRRIGWILLLLGAILAAGNALLFIAVPDYSDAAAKELRGFGSLTPSSAP